MRAFRGLVSVQPRPRTAFPLNNQDQERRFLAAFRAFCGRVSVQPRPRTAFPLNNQDQDDAIPSNQDQRWTDGRRSVKRFVERFVDGIDQNGVVSIEARPRRVNHENVERFSEPRPTKTKTSFRGRRFADAIPSNQDQRWTAFRSVSRTRFRQEQRRQTERVRL